MRKTSGSIVKTGSIDDLPLGGSDFIGDDDFVGQDDDVDGFWTSPPDHEWHLGDEDNVPIPFRARGGDGYYDGSPVVKDWSLGGGGESGGRGGLPSGGGETVVEC